MLPWLTKLLRLGLPMILSISSSSKEFRDVEDVLDLIFWGSLVSLANVRFNVVVSTMRPANLSSVGMYYRNSAANIPKLVETFWAGCLHPKKHGSAIG
jgi:hypothetical protein